MADTFTTPLRLPKLETGAYIDTWGTEYGEMLDLVADAMDGREAFTLSTTKTLSTANGADDEDRARFIDVTSGTGGTVTTTTNTRIRAVRNSTSGLLTITTGSGNTAVFKPSETGLAFCDGTDYERLGGYPEWLAIANGTSLSGTAYTLTSTLLQYYSDIIIILQGASHDSGSAQSLRLSLDGSPPSHTYFQTLRSSIAGTTTAWAEIHIRKPRRASQATCFARGGVSIATENAWEPNSTNVFQATYYTNSSPLGSIKIDFGGTASFDAGLVYVLARP